VGVRLGVAAGGGEVVSASPFSCYGCARPVARACANPLPAPPHHPSPLREFPRDSAVQGWAAGAWVGGAPVAPDFTIPGNQSVLAINYGWDPDLHPCSHSPQTKYAAPLIRAQLSRWRAQNWEIPNRHELQQTGGLDFWPG